MKLAIVGSRHFTNNNLAKSIIYDYCSIWYPDEIISGGAKGADTIAKEFAFEHGMLYTEFEADWKQYGKGAGHIRNTEMALECDEALAFWNYKSPGTRHMINELWKLKKNATVFDFVKEEFFYIKAMDLPIAEEKLRAKR